MVADWLRRNRPDSKVIVLDANPDIVVERDSFGARFSQYGVEYRANVRIRSVAPTAPVPVRLPFPSGEKRRPSAPMCSTLFQRRRQVPTVC